METIFYQASQMDFASGLALITIAFIIAVIAKRFFNYE